MIAPDRFGKLLSPITITPRLTLKNRLVVPPMGQLRGLTSPEGIRWYKRLADSGAGLVICEATSVETLSEDNTLDAAAELVATLHDAGSAAALQLAHGRSRQQPLEVNEVSAEWIERGIEQYAAAAEFCVAAGFDAVEIHGAHNFLLNKFFMPDVNHRADAWGGSVAGRGRLAVEIVRAVRAAVGQKLAILYRHTPVAKAYGLDESLELAEALLAAGVDTLHISPGCQADEAPGTLAEPFKRSEKLKVPVMTVGGFDDLVAAEDALAAGRCDLVAVGRQMIADAQFFHKTLENRNDEILRCIHCNAGCHGAFKTRTPVVCTLWPEPFEELL